MGKHRIEILPCGNKDVINIEGCKFIEKYTLEQISILLSDRTLTVKGKNLSMPIMVSENLCINGCIESLNFTPKEDK